MGNTQGGNPKTLTPLGDLPELRQFKTVARRRDVKFNPVSPVGRKHRQAKSTSKKDYRCRTPIFADAENVSTERYIRTLAGNIRVCMSELDLRQQRRRTGETPTEYDNNSDVSHANGVYSHYLLFEQALQLYQKKLQYWTKQTNDSEKLKERIQKNKQVLEQYTALQKEFYGAIEHAFGELELKFPPPSATTTNNPPINIFYSPPKEPSFRMSGDDFPPLGGVVKKINF